MTPAEMMRARVLLFLDAGLPYSEALRRACEPTPSAGT